MTTASVKLTAEEMFQLRHNAKEKRMTISEFLRAGIAMMTPRPRKAKWKVTGVPGRVILVPPPGTPPITRELVRAEMEKMDEEYLMSKAL
jgi:hypothetical protein